MVVSSLAHFGNKGTSHELWIAVRPPPTTSWHTIFSFANSSNAFLRTIPKGAHVYVETSYELREPPDSENQSAHRQIFLRHGMEYPLAASMA